MWTLSDKMCQYESLLKSICSIPGTFYVFCTSKDILYKFFNENKLESRWLTVWVL